MSYKIIILTVFISTFCRLSAKVAPDYIHICPGLKSDCLKDNIQKTIPHFVKGVPNLGLIATDPLQVDYLKLDLPGDLKIEFFNGNITGVRKCIVDSVKYEDYTADLTVNCELVVKGKYKARGKILLFTIDGDGDAKIKIKSMIVNTKLFFEDKVRQGVTYHEIKNIKWTSRFGDKVSFVFTNLFKGNPELSQTILTFLNENWEQVVDEFGKPMVNEALKLTLNVVKKFFKKIPKNELIA
ncbi:protein takeout-like [Epargyreus clarus]|uniref:protein takeout-like n=1 Tax=Epargyreus clarus TaxID=520877 RepID=UPI003C2D72C1